MCHSRNVMYRKSQSPSCIMELQKSNRPEHFDDVDNIKGMFKVLPMYPSLKLYGKLKAELEQKGLRLDDFDLLIGATSIVNKMTMVTSNTRHFERIPGIRLEDWAK